MNRKVVHLEELKVNEKDGTFSALFAPFLSVDHHNDVTLPGAFGKQNVIISAYGHGSWGGMLPVGKGVIHDEGQAGGVVEGRFFLDTTQGNDTYIVVKELGDKQEWSYALPDIEFEMMKLQALIDQGLHIQMNDHAPEETVRVLKRISVPEVSPVLLGAGVGTRTLDIKSQPLPLIEHVRIVASDAQQVLDRIKDVAKMREANDRTIAQATIKEVFAMRGVFEEMVRELEPVAEKHSLLYAQALKFQQTLSKRS